MKKNKRSLITLFLVLFSVIVCLPESIGADIFYTPGEYNEIYNEKVALEIELKTVKRQYKNEVAALNNKVSDLEREIDKLNRKIENINKQMAEEEQLANKRIMELEKRTDILNKKGSAREKQLVEENRKLQERYEKELLELRLLLKQEREKHIAEMNTLRNEYEKKIQQLESVIANLKEELSETINLNKKQKQELERMESQAKELENQLADEIKKGEIRLKRLHGKLIINIDDRISFDSGSSELKKGVFAALKKIRDILSNYPEYSIVVEGHTDNVPIHTKRFRGNWQLSTERALSVLEYLLINKSLNPVRFSAAGYGEFNPIVSNETANNRSLNRRVDIVVIPRLKDNK